MIMHCPKCGYVVTDSDAECPKCGVIFERYQEYIKKETEAQMLSTERALNRKKHLPMVVISYILSVVSLVAGITIFLTGKGPRGQDMLQHQYSNPLLKFEAGFLFVFMSIPFLLTPYLLKKGILTLDRESSEYLKAKDTFIFASLSLPTVFVFFIDFYNEGCNSGLNCNKAILAAVIFFGLYLSSILTLIRRKDKFT